MDHARRLKSRASRPRSTGVIYIDGVRRTVKPTSRKRRCAAARGAAATQAPPAHADQDRTGQQQEQEEELLSDQLFDDAEDALYDDSSDSESDGEQQQQHGQQPHPHRVQQIMAEWSSQYKQYAFYNALQLRSRVHAECQQLQMAANDIRCLQCGNTQQGLGGMDVHIGTPLALHCVRIHTRRCGCNQQQPWLPSPIQFDCLGGNVAAYTLQGSTQGGALPLLLTRQLLADLDRSYQHLKGTSIYGFTAKLWETWLESSKACSLDPQQPRQVVFCKLPYQQDTIRRRLTMALHLYRSFEQCLHHVVEQLPEWPLDPAHPCAACVPGDIHLHYDHHCSARLLKRSGYTLEYQQPPNQSKIMCNADVLKGLAEADAAIKQTAASLRGRAAGAPAAAGASPLATAAAPPAAAAATGAITAAAGAAPAAAAAGGAAGAAPPAAVATGTTDHEQEGEAHAAAAAAPAPAAAQQAEDASAASLRARSAVVAAADAANSAAPGAPAMAAALAAAANAADASCGSNSTRADVVPLSCSDFRADRLAAKDSDGYMITGLGVVACRHGHIYLMLNCFEGERHAYALTALKHLSEQGVVPRVWWYDINCRWSVSFQRWLQQQPEDVQQTLRGLSLPIPPWHLFAHQSACKVQFGHLHIPGTGRGSGEVCEIVNAVLAPLGLTSKYMAPAVREALYERMAHLRGRALDAKLPGLLLEMLLRAQREMPAVEADVGKMEQLLRMALMQQQQANASDRATDLHQRMQEEVERAKAQLLRQTVQLTMCWQGEYVRAYLVVQRHQAIAGSASSSAFLPPMSLLFPAAAVDSLKVNAAAVKASTAAMRRIQQEHFNGGVPRISDPQVQLGVSQWVAAAIGQQKERLETTIRHVQFLNSLVQPLATARQQSQKKKVLRQKQIMQQKAEAQLSELHRAAKWALALKQHNVVTAWEGHLGAQLTALVTTTCQQLKAALDSSVVGGLVEVADSADHSSVNRQQGGAVGDQDQQGAATAGSAAAHTAEEAALRLYLLRLRKSHLEEEVELVQKERGQLLGNLRQRILVLTSTLASDDAACDDDAPQGTDDVTGVTYLLARELQHTEGLLAAAERLHGAAVDGAAAALAATEAMLQEGGAIEEWGGDGQL